ncbi:hypothetical protein G4B88_009550 [Cannabis sativa]|uniref:Uncharacterized protein n=1 Tax=Cannabis sativa TaxID=3483 RepID=A0A7J6EAC1_CANSA|nr:hypothetical protein G4B88_009550 [Cannabis sativa]
MKNLNPPNQKSEVVLDVGEPSSKLPATISGDARKAKRKRSDNDDDFVTVHPQKNLFPIEEESLSLHLDGFFVDKNLDEIGKEKSLEIDDVGSQGSVDENSSFIKFVEFHRRLTDISTKQETFAAEFIILKEDFKNMMSSSESEDEAENQSESNICFWERFEEIRGLWISRDFLSPHRQSSLLSAFQNEGWLSEASHNQATRFGELPSWAMALSDSIHDAVLSCSIHVPTDLESCNGRRNELLSPFPSDFLWRQPLFDQLIANLYHPVSTTTVCSLTPPVTPSSPSAKRFQTYKNLSKQRGCGGGESVAKGIARMARDQIVNGPLKDEFVGVSLIAEATGGDEHDGALTKDLASDVNVEESDPNVVVENAGTIDHVTSHIERRISKPSLHLQSLYAQQLSSSSKATVVTMLKVYVLCNNLLLTMSVMMMRKPLILGLNLDKYGQLLYFVPAVNKLDPDFDFASVNPIAPFPIVNAEVLPEQVDNDYGAFIAAFAEYCIEGKNIHADFDVEEYHLRHSVLLYKFGLMKQVENVVSEPEAHLSLQRRVREKRKQKQVI